MNSCPWYTQVSILKVYVSINENKGVFPSGAPDLNFLVNVHVFDLIVSFKVVSSLLDCDLNMKTIQMTI